MLGKKPKKLKFQKGNLLRISKGQLQFEKRSQTQSYNKESAGLRSPEYLDVKAGVRLPCVFGYPVHVGLHFSGEKESVASDLLYGMAIP